jgi:hypothetical protein
LPYLPELWRSNRPAIRETNIPSAASLTTDRISWPCNRRHEDADRKDKQIMPSAEVTTEFLQRFADAWNRHDVDARMSFMTEDCVFEASAGLDGMPLLEI